MALPSSGDRSQKIVPHNFPITRLFLPDCPATVEKKLLEGAFRSVNPMNVRGNSSQSIMNRNLCVIPPLHSGRGIGSQQTRKGIVKI